MARSDSLTLAVQMYRDRGRRVSGAMVSGMVPWPFDIVRPVERQRPESSGRSDGGTTDRRVSFYWVGSPSQAVQD
jgi:hypothetical protein